MSFPPFAKAGNSASALPPELRRNCSFHPKLFLRERCFSVPSLMGGCVASHFIRSIAGSPQYRTAQGKHSKLSRSSCQTTMASSYRSTDKSYRGHAFEPRRCTQPHWNISRTARHSVIARHHDPPGQPFLFELTHRLTGFCS